jgi:hypothetical protein
MPSARWRGGRLDLVLGGEFDLLQELPQKHVPIGRSGRASRFLEFARVLVGKLVSTFP